MRHLSCNNRMRYITCKYGIEVQTSSTDAFVGRFQYRRVYQNNPLSHKAKSQDLLYPVDTDTKPS
jgi:hypothetical protein